MRHASVLGWDKGEIWRNLDHEFSKVNLDFRISSLSTGRRLLSQAGPQMHVSLLEQL